MKWGLVIANRARRPIRGSAARDQQVILDALFRMEEDPFFSSLKSMRGLSCLQLMAGDWSILFDISEAEKIIMVLAVRKRRDDR